MAQHSRTKTLKAARMATASSAVTIPRPLRPPAARELIAVAPSDSEAAEAAGEGSDHLQDELQNRRLHRPARHYAEQHPGDRHGRDDADRPLSADHAPLAAGQPGVATRSSLDRHRGQPCLHSGDQPTARRALDCPHLDLLSPAPWCGSRVGCVESLRTTGWTVPVEALVVRAGAAGPML